MIANQYRNTAPASASPASGATAKSRTRTIVEKLADAMREMAFANETVSIDTLTARGFSPAVVTRYGEDALVIARRRCVRQV